ncbi:MAG: type II secretion system F family protein [Candidatus Micrarchaeia archaeon]
MIELVVFLVASVLVVALFFHFYKEYEEEQALRELEGAVPNALFQLASFPSHTPMEELFESLAQGSFGGLSRVFARIQGRINAGESVPKALSWAAKNSKSRLLRKTLVLLKEAYFSGADLSVALKNLAEDVFELQDLKREASSAQAIQKYTVLASSALFVPAILGLVLGIVGSLALQVSGIQVEEFSSLDYEGLLQAFDFASQIYVLEFAVLASVFAASVDGNPRKAVLYCAFLIPSAFAVFFVVKTTGFA